MGTEYIIYNDADREKNITIDEMSNNLSLFVNTEDSIHLIIRSVSPADMMKVFMDGIKVCSYWMRKEEFQKEISKLEEYSV